MLKSGILEDELVRATDEGTPQGSILSPLLSNIYLHYVLDLWFSERVRRQCDGEAHYFRFADDFLACFRYKADAERFHRQLKERLEEFGLELAEEKTHRHGAGNPPSLPSWASRTTVGKPRRATSRSSAAPAGKSWGKACAISATGQRKPAAC